MKLEFKKPDISELSKTASVVDMHFHTNHSFDAFGDPRIIAKLCRKKNMGVAITDHDQFKGAAETVKHGEDLLIIPGIEITSREVAHVIIYFYSVREGMEYFQKEVKSHFVPRDPYRRVNKSARDIILEAKKYNCKVCIPHPFALGYTALANSIPVDNELLKCIDIIEVINGYNMRSDNILAKKWAEQTRKGSSGGSDGHFTNRLGRVAVCNQGTDIDSFLKNVSQNKSHIVGMEDSLLMRFNDTALRASKIIKQPSGASAGKFILQRLSCLLRFHFTDYLGNKRLHFRFTP